MWFYYGPDFGNCIKIANKHRGSVSSVIFSGVATPDKTNEESVKWTKDIIDIILKYRLKDQSPIKRMQS